MNDEQLRDRFAELRTDDGERAPAFARTVSRRSSRGRGGTFIVTAVAAAAAAMVVSVARGHDIRATQAITTWHPATDALLEIGTPTAFVQLQALGTSSLNSLVPLTRSPSGTRK